MEAITFLFLLCVGCGAPKEYSIFTGAPMAIPSLRPGSAQGPLVPQPSMQPLALGIKPGLGTC